MPRVLLQNVTKTYGKTKAVDDLTLEVGDGEFVSILGRPSSGKSTVLRLISGLEIPDTGSIYIGDKLVNDVDPSKRHVSMVFQSFALYPHLTVYQNLAFPLRKQNLSQDQIKADVSEVAKLLGITPLLEKKPGQLSGGEKQRLAIGRSLVRKPFVLLMDNPLSNLDAQLRLHMRAELKRIHRELRQTIIFATSDELEAMTITEKIAVVEQGKLLQYGTTNSVYDEPSNVFVAKFVGSPPMNLWEGVLKMSDSNKTIDCGIFSMEVSKLNQFKDGEVGHEVIVGVRPSGLLLSKNARNKPSFKADVLEIELTGTEKIVDMEAGETIFKSTVDADYEINVGDQVYVEFEPSAIKFFDKKTQLTIAS